MPVSHAPVETPTTRPMWSALEALPQRVSALLETFESSNEPSFEDFERELHAVFAQTECAVTEEALARQDVDLPFVHIDGEVHHRACRCEKTYLSGAGPVTVTRTLYRARRDERAVAALEREVGIIEGYWTPLAARQAAMLVAHLTPREAEECWAVSVTCSRRGARSTDCPRRSRHDGRRKSSRPRCARPASRSRRRRRCWWSRSTG